MKIISVLADGNGNENENRKAHISSVCSWKMFIVVPYVHNVCIKK